MILTNVYIYITFPFKTEHFHHPRKHFPAPMKSVPPKSASQTTTYLIPFIID